MQSSKPPALAIWLLEHMTPEGKGSPLAGDLAEEFNKRRSATWYWRQVAVAILMYLFKRLRPLWVAATATMLFASLLSAFPHSLKLILNSHQFEAFFDWGIRLSYPLSIISALAFFSLLYVVPLLVVMIIDLGVLRRSGLNRFLRGLLAGLATLPLTWLGLLILPLHTASGTFPSFLIGSLPLFCGLLTAIWIAEPRNSDRRMQKAT